MKKALLGVAGAITALSLGSAALAKTTTVTYFGNITSGSDVEGYFGSIGADLTSDAMSLSYTYDTSLGNELTDGLSYDELNGGLGQVASSPILQATLSVNGSKYSFTPDYYGDVQTGDFVFDFTDASYDVNGLAGIANSLAGDDSSVVMQTDKDPPLTSLETPFASTGFGLGYIDTTFNTADGNSDSFDFTISSVAVGAAPEPATWALMFIGIGGVGISLRRRKKPAGANLLTA